MCNTLLKKFKYHKGKELLKIDITKKTNSNKIGKFIYKAKLRING